jgi:hypothetical protein
MHGHTNIKEGNVFLLTTYEKIRYRNQLKHINKVHVVLISC